MITDLRDIVRERGGDIYAGGRAATIPGPGHSRNDRSLSLRLSDEGRVIFHSFANDPCAEIMQYLGLEAQHSQEANPTERLRLRKLRDDERRRQAAEDRAFCAGVWSETLPIGGTVVEAYLWSRGLILEDVPDIRFHPAAPRAKPRKAGDDRPPPIPHPAMVAVARGADGAPRGLHVTFLSIDGTGKAFGDRSRLMFGEMRGTAVHLSPPGPVLAVGEGIETCAAYRARTGLPTWALLTTSQFASFVLPARVRRLVIAADGDKGGMNAALGLVERMRRACDVEIDSAPADQDWADVWSAANV